MSIELLLGLVNLLINGILIGIIIKGGQRGPQGPPGPPGEMGPMGMSGGKQD